MAVSPPPRPPGNPTPTIIPGIPPVWPIRVPVDPGPSVPGRNRA